ALIELIELIQTRLGEELTAEQISEIRAKLADLPRLPEALLEELSLDQGPPTEYAPVVTSFDDVIARIEILAVARRRERRMALAVLGTLVIVLLVAWTPAVISWLGKHDDRGSPPVVARATRPATAPATAGSKPAADTRVAPAPKVRLDDGKIATRKEPDAKGVAASKTRPAGLDAPAGFPMTWREYFLPDSTEGSDWRKDVEKLLQRRQGKDPDWSSDNKYYQLDGTYGLGSLPATGRMLRLGVYQSQKCDLEFWNRNDGVRILIEPQKKRIQVHSLTRKDARAKPTVTGSLDDMGAWQWYRLGAIDLRYQDGQILICRGEIPLLRAAMPRPPTEGSLVGTGVRLRQAEARTCRPLAIPAAEKIDKTLITHTSAGKLTWKKKPEDKTELSTDPGGVVSLSSEKDKDNDTGRAWFELDIPQITGMEVTMHVRECTPLAGIFVHVKNAQDQIRMVLHKGKRVVGSGNQQEMTEDILMGRVIDKEFWIRIRCGLDFLMVWVSPDGKRWWRRKYQPFYHSPGRLQIGLEIHQGKGPRRIAVDDVRIRRFEAIRRMVAPEAGLLAKATEALTGAALNASNRAKALAIMDKA
ncbi:MAG: hypothetical protein KAX78_04875, partial [Phycisphaerae bacterium]|nr:hypothetical protein [Phycisphaerae bacterium]